MGQVGKITGYINSIAAASTYAADRLNNSGQDIRIGFSLNEVGRAQYGPAFGQSLMGSGFSPLEAGLWQPGELSVADARFVADAHMCIP